MGRLGRVSCEGCSGGADVGGADCGSANCGGADWEGGMTGAVVVMFSSDGGRFTLPEYPVEEDEVRRPAEGLRRREGVPCFTALVVPAEDAAGAGRDAVGRDACGSGSGISVVVGAVGTSLSRAMVCAGCGRTTGADPR